MVDTVTLFVFFKSIFDDDHIETQDEVFVVQHCIFWSTHYQIGKSSHTLDTQKCQVMQSYDDEVSMEQYSKISICKNSLVEGKKHAHEDGYSSLVEPRLVSAKVLVISTDNFSTNIPAQKQSQSTIKSVFQWLSQNDIQQSNDAQKEMEIAKFFAVKILQTDWLNWLDSRTSWIKQEL